MTEKNWDPRPWCFYCGKLLDEQPPSKCCSPECEQAAAATERRSLDEVLDDRLEQTARFKFLRPINPDPVTEMAKELKRKI